MVAFLGNLAVPHTTATAMPGGCNVAEAFLFPRPDALLQLIDLGSWNGFTSPPVAALVRCCAAAGLLQVPKSLRTTSIYGIYLTARPGRRTAATAVYKWHPFPQVPPRLLSIQYLPTEPSRSRAPLLSATMRLFSLLALLGASAMALPLDPSSPAPVADINMISERAINPRFVGSSAIHSSENIPTILGFASNPPASHTRSPVSMHVWHHMAEPLQRMGSYALRHVLRSSRLFPR